MKNTPFKRRALCLALMFANFGAFFVPALLETQELEFGVFFESEHDPNLCNIGHDHSICLQYSSGKLCGAALGYGLDDGHISVIEYSNHSSEPLSAQSEKGHRERAPPIS